MKSGVSIPLLLLILFIPETHASAGELHSAAQRVAERLEREGSPIPYLRQMKSEHVALAGEHEMRSGSRVDLCPEHITEDYLDELEANWAKLSAVLPLEELCREAGRHLQVAIEGRQGEGSYWSEMMRGHEDAWRRQMKGDNAVSVGFDDFWAAAERRMMSADPWGDLAAAESGLSEHEQVELARLLRKESFAKSDFAALEEFYAASFDKLAAQGKTELSLRIERGLAEGERSSRLPVLEDLSLGYGLESFERIEDEFLDVFAQVDAALPEAQAEAVKVAILSMFKDLARMAYSEFEARALLSGVDGERLSAAPGGVGSGR